MDRNYWLDLFTGKTWDEFKAHGANISGFRRRRIKLAKGIKPGDYLLCYLTGLSRFIGVLEVLSQSFEDNTKIWDDSVFPVRFKVRVVHELTPETAVPVSGLIDSLSVFKNLKSKHAWTGFFRGSPAIFPPEDGQIIVDEIIKAMAAPIKRDYDESKYYRTPKIFESKKLGAVTVPDSDIDESRIEQVAIKVEDISTHDQIQYLLLKLGSDMGLDVWVARNDRNRIVNGQNFSNIKNIRNELPRQFDEATSRTIELIDVLWLDGDAIVAAFEIEHTTSIYSGLLRMSDLVSMQPNIKINLYLVAPDDKRDKVMNEINRPTFAKLKPPLPTICKYVPYSKLKSELASLGSRVKFIRPEFIADIAEDCLPEEV